MVGTPSIVYIIFAVHKRNKIPPTCLNGGDGSHDDHKGELDCVNYDYNNN